MGKSKGAAGSKISGKIGPLTYQMRDNEQIVYESPVFTKTRNRTEAMLDWQCHWAATASAYPAFDGLLEDAFETDKTYQNTYTQFMAANVREAQAYVTRGELAQGTMVLENFVVSRGTHLKTPVAVYPVGASQVSDIALGGLQIGAATTVNELVSAILSSNPGRFKENDSIYFIRATQTPATDQLPAGIAAYSQQFILGYDTDRAALLSGRVGADGFASVQATLPGGASDTFLSCAYQPGSLVAWVQSRNISRSKSNTLFTCTTQRLQGDNPLLALYTGPVARTLAYNSYGGVNAKNHIATTNPPSKPSAPEATLGKVTLYTLASPATGGAVQGAGLYPAGADVPLKALPAQGYAFDRWNDGSTDAERTIQMPAAPVTYTAYFVPEEGGTGNTGPTLPGGPGTVEAYTITPRVEPDASYGTITMTPSQMPVLAGTQVRLTATPAGGKRLVSWSDGSTEATITVTADSNRTVTATFATIATGGGGNGGGLGSKSRKSRKSGK